MRTSLIFALIFTHQLGIAQVAPTSLRADVTVDHYMDVRSDAVRLAVDPITDLLYYMRTNGDLLLVIDNNVDAPYDTLLFTAADHALDQAFGMAFHDSDLFVIGNQVNGNLTQGQLKRAHLLADGTRTWNTVATTGNYAWGGKAHAFNNVVVSPDGQFLYLNSGSRTDHGEVQDVNGTFPELREEPVTAKILRVPADGVNLILPNNEAELLSDGHLFASGVRNTFDMAFDADDRLFGVENSGDHDDPEEMNWLREGHHYGFPWTAGGNMNPTLNAGYTPGTDALLNPGYPAASTDFNFDPGFPLPPNVVFTEPVINLGPDADRLRDPLSGGITDASDTGSGVTTFTCHRSPLGLVFDRNGVLEGGLHEDAFALSFTPGGDTTGFSPIAPWGIPVVPADPSEDLLHLDLSYDANADNFTLNATRIVEGFYLPVDAELVGNVLYVLENWGSVQRSMWKVTLPLANSVEEGRDQRTERLTVWPVPARDEVTWSYDGVVPLVLELLDAAGRIIVSVRPHQPSGTLDVSDIPAGYYVIHARSEGGNSIRKITIVR